MSTNLKTLLIEAFLAAIVLAGWITLSAMNKSTAVIQTAALVIIGHFFGTASANSSTTLTLSPNKVSQ